MTANARIERSASRRGARKLLLGTAGLLALGTVVAQVATVSKKPAVSGFISTSLAALIAARAPVAAPAPTPTPAPLAVARGFKLGINATGIDYYNNDRPFMNLVYGSFWHLNGAGGGYRAMPGEYIDANGWVKALPAGGQAVKLLSHPNVPAGGLDIVCKFDGNGILSVVGAVSQVERRQGETKFRIMSRYPQRENLVIFYDQVTPSDPIRNIDCREPTADRNQVFSPEFLSFMRTFGIIRFMDWQSTNLSHAVNWTSRNRPSNGDYLLNGGVPIEVLVELTKQTSADPWFNVSWNADADYVRRYAEYVRDNVPVDRMIYVETSNEVWNAIFAASQQAEREGLAKGFNTDPFVAKLSRYAERSTEVFKIWTEVFAGQMHRLTRVVNTQHVNPWTAEQVLGFRDTANWVDALATAPYFGYGLSSQGGTPDLTPMFAQLRAEIPVVIAQGLANKAVAARFGKRYVTYEAGQHVIMHNDQATLARLNRDSRMEGVYTDYMNAWRGQVGDPLLLFSATSPVSVWGAWGLNEYVGQPASEAPKLRAVQAFRN